MSSAVDADPASDERVVGTSSRAAVLVEPGRIQVQSVDIRNPDAGEVVVGLEGCGVCGSNVAPWQGADWFEYPFPPGSPGHEGWGIVEAVGQGVAGVREGDRVATLGDRAFANRMTVPAAEVVRLPEELDGRPFPGEPLACAMNIFERSRIEAGDTVAIVGIGFMGALLTQLAVAAGARVLALSRRGYALEVARQCAADATYDVEEPETTVSAIEAATGGDGCDVVIEATGKQAPLDLAARLTRVRGRLVIAGYHQDGPRQVNMQLWNWRGLDVINAHERDPSRYVEGMRAAVDATLDGRLDADPLITHTYPLDRLDQALDAARSRPDHFLKAIITP